MNSKCILVFSKKTSIIRNFQNFLDMTHLRNQWVTSRASLHQFAIFTFAITFIFLLHLPIQQIILNHPQSQHMTYPYSLNQNYMQSAKHVETVKFVVKSTVVKASFLTIIWILNIVPHFFLFSTSSMTGFKWRMMESRTCRSKKTRSKQL